MQNTGATPQDLVVLAITRALLCEQFSRARVNACSDSDIAKVVLRADNILALTPVCSARQALKDAFREHMLGF